MAELDAVSGRFRAALSSDSLADLEEVVWPEAVLSSVTVGAPCDYPPDFKGGQPALHAACSNPESVENLEVIRWLISKTPSTVPRVDPTSGFTALHSAALHGNNIALRALLHADKLNPLSIEERLNGASKSGMTALHLAGASGEADVVEHLLSQREINVDCRTSSGFTSAMQAVVYAPVSNGEATWAPRKRLVDLLIRASPTCLEQVDKEGDTVFHLLARRAPMSEDKVIWEHLFALAPVETIHRVNQWGETALAVACRFHQLSAIAFLLSRSQAIVGDLLVPNKFGQYPHHLLFEQEENPELLDRCARLVLEALGCDIGCTLVDVNKQVLNNEMDTVLSAAIKRHVPFRTVHLLLKGGADLNLALHFRLPDLLPPPPPQHADSKLHDKLGVDSKLHAGRLIGGETHLQLAARVHPKLLMELIKQLEGELLDLRRQMRADARHAVPSIDLSYSHRPRLPPQPPLPAAPTAPKMMRHTDSPPSPFHPDHPH